MDNFYGFLVGATASSLDGCKLRCELTETPSNRVFRAFIRHEGLNRNSVHSLNTASDVVFDYMPNKIESLVMQGKFTGEKDFRHVADSRSTVEFFRCYGMSFMSGLLRAHNLVNGTDYWLDADEFCRLSDYVDFGLGSVFRPAVAERLLRKGGATVSLETSCK